MLGCSDPHVDEAHNESFFSVGYKNRPFTQMTGQLAFCDLIFEHEKEE
jgi:hypothetical protein